MGCIGVRGGKWREGGDVKVERTVGASVDLLATGH